MTINVILWHIRPCHRCLNNCYVTYIDRENWFQAVMKVSYNLFWQEKNNFQYYQDYECQPGRADETLFNPTITYWTGLTDSSLTKYFSWKKHVGFSVANFADQKKLLIRISIWIRKHSPIKITRTSSFFLVDMKLNWWQGHFWNQSIQNNSLNQNKSQIHLVLRHRMSVK